MEKKILDELEALNKKLDVIMTAIDKFWPGLLQGQKVRTK